MNIGFDLDRIFINHPPYISNKFIDLLYKESVRDELKYRIPSIPEQKLRLLTHYSKLRKPMKQNIQFIEDLAAKNHNKHFLISGRFAFLEKTTQKLIKQYNFDKIFNAMYFNFENKQPHVFKDEIIKKKHIDLYIDDDLDLLAYLAPRNPKTKFFWFNDKKDFSLCDNLLAITELKKMTNYL